MGSDSRADIRHLISAYCMPEIRSKKVEKANLMKKSGRKNKKHSFATGNPVKAGYIIMMICPGFCPEGIPFR